MRSSYSYGSHESSPLTKTHVRRRNVQAPLLSFLLPLAVFAGVAALLSFQIRCAAPWFAWFGVFLVAALVGVCAYLAGVATWKRLHGLTDKEPTWYIFLTFMMLAAWLMAVIVGDMNFWASIRPWCDLQNLSSYGGVDASASSGDEYADASRIVFKPGTRLDMASAYGFKNKDQYCVAPIVTGNATGEAQHDFWAVGLNCCGGPDHTIKFHCGAYDDATARGGLRLTTEEQRAFYRLAVQQVEANSGIKANRPVFFYWTKDPEREMDRYINDAVSFYGLGVAVCVAVQLCILCIAMMVFSKLGIA